MSGVKVNAVAHGSGVLDTWERPARDGALRCALCATSSAEADHEWCAVAESLICDECCSALLHGSLMRMFAIAAHAGRVVTPETLLQGCSQCQRALRHAEDQLLEEDDAGDVPAC